MKRYLAAMTLCLALMVGLSGCPGTTPANPTTPAQLAPGYQNAVDQQMGEILSGARAFYTSIQQQSVAGTLTLSPSVKTAFNTFGASLNAAESVYLAYHGGTATQAQAQALVNQVQSQQAALPLPGAKP
jgi:hypothetical protein